MVFSERFTNSPQSLCLDQTVPCVMCIPQLKKKHCYYNIEDIVITFYYHLRNVSTTDCMFLRTSAAVLIFFAPH